MRARPNCLEEADQVTDIFIEAEATGSQRYVAYIVPVGDVDVVLRQHRAYRAAHERGEMAGQRRNQEHARLRGIDVLLEVQERAEGRRQRGLLIHRQDRKSTRLNSSHMSI